MIVNPAANFVFIHSFIETVAGFRQWIRRDISKAGLFGKFQDLTILAMVSRKSIYPMSTHCDLSRFESLLHLRDLSIRSIQKKMP